MKIRESGQALVEFGISTLLCSVVIIGATAFLKAQWNRAKCAYVVFEATHARLTNRETLPNIHANIQITESQESVRGEGRCSTGGMGGRAHEKVEFQKLETARW